VAKLSLVWDGVSLAITHQPIDSRLLTSHLHLTLKPNVIAPNLDEHLPSVLLPFHYSQTVSDPSILHLIQLLQAEMLVPQPMNQMFVSSIVTVLTTYLLQNFQLEQGRQ
jgi:hypothetical protein